MILSLRCFKSPPKCLSNRFAVILLNNNLSHKLHSTVSTFNPAKVTPDDHLDISNIIRPNIHIPSLAQSPTSPNPDFYLPYSHSIGRKGVPFPPDTKGFLVFETQYPREAPELGRLVFRLVPTPDPSLISAAPLYCRPTNHAPWSVNLFSITKGKGKQIIMEQLLKDRLVTPSLLDRCRQLGSKFKPIDSTPILCSLEQPWLFDFSHGWQKFYVLGHERMAHCALSWHSKAEYVVSGKRAMTGKAFVAFHSIKHRLFIRIVKVLEPIRYKVDDNKEVTLDGYVPGAYIPNRLSSPVLDLNAPLALPKVTNVLYNPYGRRNAQDPTSAWFRDPFDCVDRGVQHLKGLRLLINQPLTDKEKLNLDLTLSERDRLCRKIRSLKMVLESGIWKKCGAGCSNRVCQIMITSRTNLENSKSCSGANVFCI
ncbi:hypothetical protein BDQ17DRAFT_223743 [Cyathus striatus]|nr:hypothetical protein BDQ17DRAFT_223743 [Cyathus striatus]